MRTLRVEKIVRVHAHLSVYLGGFDSKWGRIAVVPSYHVSGLCCLQRVGLANGSCIRLINIWDAGRRSGRSSLLEWSEISQIFLPPQEVLASSATVALPYLFALQSNRGGSFMGVKSDWGGWKIRLHREGSLDPENIPSFFLLLRVLPSV